MLLSKQDTLTNKTVYIKITDAGNEVITQEEYESIISKQKEKGMLLASKQASQGTFLLDFTTFEELPKKD